MRIFRQSIVVGLFCLSWASLAAGASGPDLYAPRPADQVRQELQRWMAHRGVTNEKTVAAIAELWAPTANSLPPRQVFERLIQSFGLADANVRQFVDACQPGVSARALPKPVLLTQ